MKRIHITSDSLQYRNVLIALLAGAGAGLAAGLLMAPKAGDQLRAGIGAKVDDGVKSATNAALRGLKEVRKTGDQAAEKVKDAVSTARAAVERETAAALPA